MKIKETTMVVIGAVIIQVWIFAAMHNNYVEALEETTATYESTINKTVENHAKEVKKLTELRERYAEIGREAGYRVGFYTAREECINLLRTCR